MSSTKSLRMLQRLERAFLHVGRAGYPTLFFIPFMPPILVPPRRGPSRPTSDVTG